MLGIHCTLFPNCAPTAESPAAPIRSITRLFTSDVEDLTWYHDRDFWNDYLTMLVTNRFQSVQPGPGHRLRFCHGPARCVLLLQRIRSSCHPKSYNVRLNEPGRQRAGTLGRGARSQSRHLAFHLRCGHPPRPAFFSLACGLTRINGASSPNVNYVIAGLDESTFHINYCRDSLELLLNECPNITGVTFRIHGESGVAEG